MQKENMPNPDCEPCENLKGLAFSRFYITYVDPEMKEVTDGFEIQFRLQGYFGRIFKAVWRRVDEMYVCDPKRLAYPCLYPATKPDFHLVPEEHKEHSKLGMLRVPRPESSGDIMLGKGFCTRNSLPFKEKWPGNLGATQIAAGADREPPSSNRFDKIPVRVHGWALAVEFPELPGLTFFISPHRREIIDDISQMGVPADPFRPETKLLELPVSRRKMQKLYNLQPSSGNDGFAPWPDQTPAKLFHATSRDSLFQGSVDKLIEDVDALREAIAKMTTPDGDIDKAIRRVLGHRLPR
jgi:hypothetical protein